MGDMGMTAVFYGGPADGALVVLREPIPTVLRMPLDGDLLDRRSSIDQVKACQLDAVYHLELDVSRPPADPTPVRYVRDGRQVVKYLVHIDRKRPANA